MAYPLETILAEKIWNNNQKKYHNDTNERLLRPIHPLQTKKYEKEAIERTSNKRGSLWGNNRGYKRRLIPKILVGSIS